MTDNEIRKAFREFDGLHFGAVRAAGKQERMALWQAAVEWATKRERHRCAELCRMVGWSDAATGNVDMGFDPTHYMPLPKGPEE